MYRRSCVAFLLVFVMTFPLVFAKSHFQYGGVGLDTQDLKRVFPTSLILNEEVWVSENDSRDSVYYIRRTYMKDRTEIKMVLEKPDKLLPKKPRTWEEGHYAKFPPCNDVLTKLVNQYGKPVKERSSWEERLKNNFRIWSYGSEYLELTCYQIDGRGKELAAEIVIGHKNDR